MQLQSKMRGVARRAHTKNRNSPRPSRAYLNFMALSDKSVDYSKVISMIEGTASLLQKEQTDDDNMKTYRLISIDRAEDEGKSLAIDMKSHKSAIADYTEQLIFMALIDKSVDFSKVIFMIQEMESLLQQED